MAYLEQRRVQVQGKKLVPLAGSTLSIGRNADCGIPLDGDPTISRVHALLEAIDGGWCLSDLGSLGGTYLNDDKVTERRAVRDRDVIRVGPWRFLFREPDDPGTTITDPESKFDYGAELTEKEEEVVRLVAEGLSAKQIAEELFLAVSTVNGYREKIKIKTGCASKVEVFELARRRGLV